MNTSSPHSNASVAEPKHSDNQLDVNREQIRVALLSLLVLISFAFLLLAPLYLPSRVVGLVLGVVPAIYMTCYLYSFPGSLRDRRGSLVTAIVLVAFLWLVAVAAAWGFGFGSPGHP